MLVEAAGKDAKAKICVIAVGEHDEEVARVERTHRFANGE